MCYRLLPFPVLNVLFSFQILAEIPIHFIDTGIEFIRNAWFLRWTPLIYVFRLVCKDQLLFCFRFRHAIFCAHNVSRDSCVWNVYSLAKLLTVEFVENNWKYSWQFYIFLSSIFCSIFIAKRQHLSIVLTTIDWQYIRPGWFLQRPSFDNQNDSRGMILTLTNVIGILRQASEFMSSMFLLVFGHR